MSLEPGGRADKYGNEYENQYLARLLLRVINEECKYVIIEPLGDNSNSMEYKTLSQNGIVEYYQCKASNGSSQSWTTNSLQKYDVFMRIKQLLTIDGTAKYRFISPLPYRELDELCKRARTSNSLAELKSYSLVNNRIRSVYKECITAFMLDENKQDEADMLHSLLSRCYFEQIPFTESATLDLEERISLTLTGDASSVRLLLESYANGCGRFGTPITAKEIVDCLLSNGHQLRISIHDDRALHRINSLNQDYWVKSPGINGKLYHREVTEQVIYEIQESHLVILHGKAGVGKSGCLQEVIDYLSDNGIIHLSVKLDKFIPSRSADQFGKELGFSQSPVYALAALAAGQPCVLILDQLDALRWTSVHSSTALEVCKELISQIVATNKYQGGRLSIVFASRTFDLENDSGLQRLFIGEAISEIQCSKICVDVFSEAEVVQIIGNIYNGLSPKLKRLLRTPSSLYVWTKLAPDKRNANIVSVRELMNEWWKQIQSFCLANGSTQTDIIRCRERIVSFMESQSAFSLSESLFADYSKIISLFKSCGMLSDNSNSISFAHQSFLDYFVSLTMLEGLYSGKTIIELMEPYEKQTPNVRYRLLTVLQELIDTDQDMFVNQARLILVSSDIHYYFKCCVFEIVGQCEEPSATVFALVDEYLGFSAWRGYIFQTVYSRHPIYMRHMAERPQDWLDNQHLSLLKSISDTDSSFVVEVLRPYAKSTCENDRKIIWALPFDPTMDTDDAFAFRFELIKRNPELLASTLGLHTLIEKKSDRAMDYLEMVLKNSTSIQLNQVYLENDAKLNEYAQIHYKLIVERLFSPICDITADYLPSLHHHEYFPEYENWIDSGYHESVLRRIVDLTKLAMIKLAKTDGDTFCELIKSVSYPLSGIGHEMIMASVRELPLEYSDYCISWLLSDFRNKVFVFSTNQSDYLFFTKEIIKKFSPNCSLQLFKELEKAICDWKEEKSHVLYLIKDRLEAMRRDKSIPEYDTYWGHFQKSVLPSLERERLSNYAKELIGVLSRNKWIRIPYYCSGFSGGMAKSVVSPIDDKTERISNNTWLQIISTPTSKMQNHLPWKESEDAYIEANHPAFSSALEKQAKLEPFRFAKLALAFPEDCYKGYVLSVLYSLGYAENSKEYVPVDLMSRVIRRFKHIDSTDISIAITWVIQKHSSEDWPSDILDLLAHYAVSHKHPGPDEYTVTSSNDPEHLSPESLLSCGLNSVRGSAVRAIGELLWHHREFGIRFRQTVIDACEDANDAVRFAVVFCLLPYFNIESELSESLFLHLIYKDLRILAAPGAWDIFTRTYMNNRNWYRTKLEGALHYKLTEINELAASWICALSVFKSDRSMMKIVMEYPFTEKQQDAICRQAVSMLSSSEFHKASELIIRRMIDVSSNQLHGFFALFNKDTISIQKDRQFLAYIMQSRQGPQLLFSFLHFLKESDANLCEYAEVFQAICDSMAERASEWQQIYILDDFVCVIIRLLDQGKNDPRIVSTCLDVWDKLFMSNLSGIKPIRDLLEEIE